MRHMVGCMDHFDSAGEGGEVCYLDVGEESIQGKGLSALLCVVENDAFGDPARGWEDSLRLELIRKNQIRIGQQTLIRRHNILRNIQLAMISHDRIQHPEETSRLPSAPCLGP